MASGETYGATLDYQRVIGLESPLLIVKSHEIPSKAIKIPSEFHDIPFKKHDTYIYIYIYIYTIPSNIALEFH